MRLQLIKKCRNIDLASVAVSVGPILIACSILAIAFELRSATVELHSHILRVLHRDSQWEPVFIEVRGYVRNNEQHMTEQDQQLAEILRRQQEILSRVGKLKFGDLMSGRHSNPYAGVNLGEIYTNGPVP